MNTHKIVHYLALLSLGALGTAHAGLTDISNAPLVTSATSSVLPNVMFIIDDSGSMDWDYMPDFVNDSFCKKTTGTYNATCCGDSATSGGSGSSACWHKSTSTAAPFGNWRGHPPFLSGTFNGVAYNPAITYTPPLNADGGSKASMTSANTSGWTSVKNDAYNVQNTQTTNLLTSFPDLAWCTDATYTDCLRNDNYFLPGTVNGKNYTTFYAVVAKDTAKLVSGPLDAPVITTTSVGPHYYAIIPGEYCDSPSLRNCQKTASATFSYPAYVRWCNSEANATAISSNPSASATLCQATKTPTYQYVRYPTRFFTPANPGSPEVPGQPYIPPTAAVKAQASFTISLTGTCNGSNKVYLSAVTANGQNILTGNTSSANTASTLANNIKAKVGNGYTATVAGSTVTLYGSLAQGNINYAVTLTPKTSGGTSCIFNATSPIQFAGGVNASPGQPEIIYQPAVPATPAVYYGSFKRVDIVPSNNSYPMPGSTAKASTRTDCAGNTCTYAEEMTNFANWWTYYHTRMQTMKSSASLAFGPIDSRYRVGFLSINNATSKDFLNLATFDATQRTSWYAKLVASKPSGSTPLRTALTKAGRLYAGKFNGTSLNGSTVVDPVQYSCQQNFTILSTDGYWNESEPGGLQIDGSTAVGDQDSALQRPQYDGLNVANSLADVASYYYTTDLRNSSHGNCTGAVVPPAASGNDVCPNNVPVSGLDAAAHQHMTTFTVGLGASGYMQYSSSYASATSGDYFDIKNGSTANNAAGICSWQNGGTCNWPQPSNNTQSTIDDLWHAAVNGYGTYFSAGNPAVLSSGISGALSGVSARTGASSAATTSNPNIATGDNFLFSSNFTSVNWDGEMVRRQINLESGAVSEGVDWSARSLLDANNARVIYTYSPGSTNRLKIFEWSSLNGSEQTYFQSPHISALSQFCSAGVTCLGATAQADAEGEKLVNFLRGDRSNEGSATDSSKYYRERSHVLGDIVNSEAVYVKTPPFTYNDGGYSGYKAAKASRQGMVYVGANDGMLHAFNADTGAEAWAYVPSVVLPNLYRLADKNYQNQHRYSVDGTVVQGDVYDGSSWRTIIVGGLNAGGRGYYAIDVTDPANPKALWEFTYDTTKGSGYTTDANLGYSFGKAEITKLKNGNWVVLVTSGYNNVSPGDGKGYLYVLNAITGAKVGSPISTNTGSTSTPSGLAQIRSWADNSELNNLAVRSYGGDILGNVWRFDIDDNLAPAGNEATLLATLKGPTGIAQPITSKPELGLVGTYPVVYVGTGSYMGVTDLSDTNKQSFYALRDKLDSSSYGNPRASALFVKQTLTDSTCPPGTSSTICTVGQQVRTSSNLPVDLSAQNGWYVDLLDVGERANTDPQLAFGTLVFTTNVPNASACTIGGYSFLYFLNYKTGGPVSTAVNFVTGKILGNALATRPVLARLPNSKIVSYTQMSGGTAQDTRVDLPPVNTSGLATRRVSWRELVSE